MKKLYLLVVSFLFLTLSALPLTAATITDSDGRQVQFDRPFKRIISLYPAHTVNLLRLGLEKEIIAISLSDTSLNRPYVRFQDDPERLLALKPDLVLIRPMISRGYPNLVRTLERHNVQVVSLQPTSMDELFTYWRNLGALTGREPQAREMIAEFQQGLQKINASLAHIPPEKRKRVYFESIHKQMKTFATSSMAVFVLEAAGGRNVARDAKQMRNTNIAAYGKERILAKANEIDLYLAQYGRMNPVSIEMILREPGFEAIRAVRERQVFLVGEEMVSRPTMELLDGIVFVRSLLYPDYSQKQKQLSAHNE